MNLVHLNPLDFQLPSGHIHQKFPVMQRACQGPNADDFLKQDRVSPKQSENIAFMLDRFTFH